MKTHTVPPLPNPHSLERMVETFKALADPTRAQIVLILANTEQSVNELVVQLQVQQSTVSRHLGVLRAANIVKTRREANRIYYRLTNSHVVDLAHQAYSHAEHGRLGLPDHTNLEVDAVKTRHE